MTSCAEDLSLGATKFFHVFEQWHGFQGHHATGSPAVLNSGSFTFIVGPNKAEFTIHKAILSMLSSKFAAQINGPWLEASTYTLPWEDGKDLDEKVFGRFAYFAYFGCYPERLPDYDSDSEINPEVETSGEEVSEAVFADLTTTEADEDDPLPPLPTSPEPISEENHGAVHECSLFTRAVESKKTQAKKLKAKNLQDVFTDEWATWPTSRRKGDNQPRSPTLTKFWYTTLFINTYQVDLDVEPEQTPSDWQWYSDACLDHAKVWILAEMYLIPSLQTYSCRRLARFLSFWVVSDDGFLKDFSRLVKYIYGFTETEYEADRMSRTRPACGLRLVVARFVVCHWDTTSSLEGWGDLMSESLEFVVDILNSMASQMAPCEYTDTIHDEGWKTH